MRKKNKKKNNKTLKALIILICTFTLVWLLSSCSEDFFDKKDSNDVNQNNVQEDINENKDNEHIEEDIHNTENNNEQQDNNSQEENNNQENEKENEIDNNIDEIPQGSNEDSFNLDIDPSTLATKSIGWSFKRNTTHEPVIGYNEGIDLQKYGAYYKVDTNEKVVYLTFDEGYEYGFTPKILDILKANNVQATFFVTESFIKNNTDLAIRMKEEGHLVGNHSSTHPKFSTLDEETLKKEIMDTQQTFEELTGYMMDSFFRPPSGDFSEKSLYLTRKLGYRSIFWSMAYADWDVNNQPGKEYAYNHVMENYHPGAIILLHAVSESNTEALNDIIISLKEEGYRFGNLYEVE